MKGRSLNLAADPFVNLRPHRRGAMVLLSVGAILLAVNVFLYWEYQSGSADARRRLREVEADLGTELVEMRRIEAALRNLGLAAQNEKVEFLNQRIAERTFPWSLFFDRLVEALPADVRLRSLTPSNESLRERRSRRRRSTTTERVVVQISGVARTDDAKREFVDSLFTHPSFEEPKLLSDHRDAGEVAFELVVRYIREPAARALVPPAGTAEETSEDDSSPFPTIAEDDDTRASSESATVKPELFVPDSGDEELLAEEEAGVLVDDETLAEVTPIPAADPDGAEPGGSPRPSPASGAPEPEVRPGALVPPPRATLRRRVGAPERFRPPAAATPEATGGSRPTTRRVPSASAPPRLRGEGR